MFKIKDRINTCIQIKNNLRKLSTEGVIQLLENSDEIYSGIGGFSSSIIVEGKKIFVKKIPISALEYQSENILSTKNLFKLPLCFQYGIGSSGYSVWRELSMHITTTKYVLNKVFLNFPIMYHWRIIRDDSEKKLPSTVEVYNLKFVKNINSESADMSKWDILLTYKEEIIYCKLFQKSIFKIENSRSSKDNNKINGMFEKIIKVMKKILSKGIMFFSDADKALIITYLEKQGYISSRVDRIVEYWGNDLAIRKRFFSRENAKMSLVLFLEHIPYTLHQWLDKSYSEKNEISDHTVMNIYKQLHSIISFMSEKKIIHFDMNFSNILTDGVKLYLTDFGLVNTINYDLSIEEHDNIIRHKEYDRIYANAMLEDWLVDNLIGKAVFKEKINEYLAGKEEKNISPYIMGLIKYLSKDWFACNYFFKEVKRMLNNRDIVQASQLWNQNIISFSSHCQDIESVEYKKKTIVS